MRAHSIIPSVVRFMSFASGYIAVIVGAVALLFCIRYVGADLIAPAPAPHQELFGKISEMHKPGALLHVLLALAVVIIAARAVGIVFRYFGQPPVIGEVVAGILLGPSLLARYWPEGSAYVFSPESAPFINVIAQIGIILYMFLVGVELNPSHLRRNSKALLAISHSSIVVPFVLGSALSLFLYPRFSTRDVPFNVFLLFMGISMSVTAFPVLARILTDRGMQRTPLGAMALTCAAVDDVTAWCLLALVVSVVKANMDEAIRTLSFSILFIAFMLLVMRHLIAALAQREEAKAETGQDAMAMMLVALLFSAFITEKIGIHALFGAFILGTLVPHDSALARRLAQRLQDVAVVFFLPAYFAFTGMRTEIGLISGAQLWLVCGLIIIVASLGKFGGSFVAARLMGLRWREGAVIGTLMNTRGLMELVVLNIGLDLKVLSPMLFTMLVLMAVMTTMATTPILDLLNRDRGVLDKPERAEFGQVSPNVAVESKQ